MPGPDGLDLEVLGAWVRAYPGEAVEVLLETGALETTYEEVRAVISAAWQSDVPTPEWIDLAAHKVIVLLGLASEEEEEDGDD